MAEVLMDIQINGIDELTCVLKKISALAEEADALIEELRAINVEVEIRNSDSH